jgi:hypothetical protein
LNFNDDHYLYVKGLTDKLFEFPWKETSGHLVRSSGHSMICKKQTKDFHCRPNVGLTLFLNDCFDFKKEKSLTRRDTPK